MSDDTQTYTLLKAHEHNGAMLPEATPGESQPVTIGGATYPLSAAAIDILRRLFAGDGQARRTIIQALSSRHDPVAVTVALRELARLGFLATDRAV